MEDNWFGVEIDIVKREIIRIVKETIESQMWKPSVYKVLKAQSMPSLDGRVSFFDH